MPQFKKILSLFTSVFLSNAVLTLANAQPISDDNTIPTPGFFIENMESMHLPDDVRKNFLQKKEQIKAASVKEVSEKNFTSLNKIAQLMKRKNGSTNNEALLLKNKMDEGKLISQPSVVNSTLLNNATLISASPAGVYSNGQWSGLSRIYSTDELNIVMLDEDDYVSVGTRIVFAKEVINESVNNAPAILSLKKSTSGENLIQLSWVTSHKDYTLSSNATDFELGKTLLLELARGIRD